MGLDFLWKCRQFIIWVIEANESIVGPKVVLVLLNVLQNRYFQWCLIIEPLKLDHPHVQIFGLVDEAHFLLVTGDNFNKVTHDIGEEGDTGEHDDYNDDLLQF